MSKDRRMSKSINKQGFPDMATLTNNIEAINRINFPDIEAIIKSGFPDMATLTNNIEAINRINFPDIEAIIKSGFPDIDKITSLGQSLAMFSDRIVEIDWRDFELTDEGIEQAHDILKGENAEEKINKEFSENKEPRKISETIKSLIYYVWVVLQVLCNLASCEQVAEYMADRVIPVVQSYTQHEHEGLFKSENDALKWIKEELKKDVSSQITKNYRKVVEDGLIVREGKTKDSRINGKLNTGNVVQIIEKRRNWSYVFYSNYEDGEVIEGWVFTRYLKQIK